MIILDSENSAIFLLPIQTDISVSEVLKIALTEAPVPIEWDEAAEEAAAAKALKEQNDTQTTKH